MQDVEDMCNIEDVLKTSLRYGFSVARCEGEQTEIDGQKVCVKPGSDEKLETIARRRKRIQFEASKL